MEEQARIEAENARRGIMPKATASAVDPPTSINLTYALYAGIVAASLLAVWWCVTCTLNRWKQWKLKARRGYDDTDLESFPKEATQGYAYDDGL